MDGTNITAYAWTVAEMTRDIVAESLPRHPLTFGAAMLPGGARRVELDADVRDGWASASYPVPVYATHFAHRLDRSLETSDQRVSSLSGVIHSAVETYESNLLHRLVGSEEGPFIGLGRYLSSSVGKAIGGIDEQEYPGWTPQVDYRALPLIPALQSLEVRCTTGRTAPDLTVLGEHRYEELVQRMQPQQRFSDVRRGVTVLRLNRGAVYCDRATPPDTVYVLHSNDFQLYVGDPIVDVVLTPEGFRLTVKRAEQLIGERRFRSGRIAAHVGSEFGTNRTDRVSD